MQLGAHRALIGPADREHRLVPAVPDEAQLSRRRIVMHTHDHTGAGLILTRLTRSSLTATRPINALTAESKSPALRDPRIHRGPWLSEGLTMCHDPGVPASV